MGRQVQNCPVGELGGRGRGRRMGVGTWEASDWGRGEETGAAIPCRLQRTPQGYLGLWLHGSSHCLSEFYYHSNEDVESYFI